MMKVQMEGWKFLKFKKVGHTAVLLLNNPPFNILTQTMCEEISKFLHNLLLSSGKYDGLLITTEGKHFSAGADIEEHLPDKVEIMLPKFHELLLTLAAYPLSTVAAITGSCIGGGLELARACQYVIAWNTKVLIGVPEITLACFPPFGIAVFPRLTSNQLKDVFRFLLSGQILNWDESDNYLLAYKMGLVDDSFSGDLEGLIEFVDFQEVQKLPRIDELFEEALPFGKGLAEFIRGAKDQAKIRHLSTPILDIAGKTLLVCGGQKSLQGALKLAEQTYLSQVVPHPHYTEALTAYLEKRPPVLT